MASKSQLIEDAGQGALFNLIDLAPLVPVAAPDEPLVLGIPEPAPQQPKPKNPEQVFEVGQQVAIASTAMLYPGKLGKVRAVSGLGYSVEVDGVVGPPWPMFLAEKLSPVVAPVAQVSGDAIASQSVSGASPGPQVEDDLPNLEELFARADEVGNKYQGLGDAIAPIPQPAPIAPPTLQIPEYAPGETLCEWRWWPDEQGGQWRYAGYMGMAGYAQPQHDDGVLLPHGFDPNQAPGIERSKP